MYNIQQWSLLIKQGHFAAKEVPEVLAQDVQKFFGNHALLALFQPSTFFLR